MLGVCNAGDRRSRPSSITKEAQPSRGLHFRESRRIPSHCCKEDATLTEEGRGRPARGSQLAGRKQGRNHDESLIRQVGV